MAYGADDFSLTTGERFVDMKFNLNLNDNISIEWDICYRQILETDRNKECPVLLEPINDGDKYCICYECKYNISKEAINCLKNKYCLSMLSNKMDKQYFII